MISRNKQRLLLLLVSAGILATSAISSLQSIDLQQMRSQINQVVLSTTGRDLKIAGSIRIKLSHTPKLIAEDVSLSNAEWGADRPMVKARRLVAGIRLWPLLTGEIEINQLKLEQADVLIETDGEGGSNWRLRKPDSAISAVELAGPVDSPITHIIGTDGRLVFLTGKKKARQEYRFARLELRLAKLNRTLRLVYNGEIKGKRVELAGSVTNLDTLIRGGHFAFDLGGRLEYQPFRATGSAEFSGQRRYFKLRDTIYHSSLGKLSGDLAFDFAEARPSIRGHISAPTLDFVELTRGRPDQMTAVPFWEKQIDRRYLRRFDAAITANIGALDNVAGYDLKGVEVSANLQNGKLTIKPFSAEAVSGRLQSSMVLDTRVTPARLKLNVTGHALNLGQVLEATDLRGAVSGGASQLMLQLNSHGETPAQMVRKLSGKVFVSVEQGRLNNAYLNVKKTGFSSQLVQALNPVSKTAKSTKLHCAVANLEFKQGVSEFDRQVALETDRMSMFSSGMIDLDRGILDIGLQPKPRAGLKDIAIGAGDLVNAVRVHGELRRPRIGLDAAGTAKAGLKVYGAIATSGLSLLVGSAFEKAIADPNPCKTAKSITYPTSSDSKSDSILTQLKRKFGA